MTTYTKQEQFIAAVKNKLVSGELKKGDKLPSERELGNQYGFSRVTIRAALKQLQTEGIIESIHGKGSFISANSPEASLELDPQMVSFVLKEIQKPFTSDPFTIMVINGAQHALLSKDVNLDILCLKKEQHLSETRHGRSLLAKNIITLNHKLTPEEWRWLKKRGHRVVSIGWQEHVADISYIEINHQFGSFLATQHLLTSGCKHIAYVGEDNSYSGIQRIAGINKALHEQNLKLKKSNIRLVHPWIEDEGYEAVDGLLKDGVKFDSLIVHGDYATVGAVKRLKEAGLCVPDDVALIMLDDFPWVLDVVKPAPTAVHPPYEELGNTAVEILLGQMSSDPKSIYRQQLMPSLIVRESTKWKAEKNPTLYKNLAEV